MAEISGKELGEVLQKAMTGEVSVTVLDKDNAIFLIDRYEVEFLFDEDVGSFLFGVMKATAPDGREGHMHRWDYTGDNPMNYIGDGGSKALSLVLQKLLNIGKGNE